MSNMSTPVPETLPETIASLARFRPVDSLDFSRRAKNLSRLLESGLQDAQELLARAYGYEHLHELQQVLKADGTPGPFDDQPLSLPLTEAAPDLRFHRQARLMRIIDGWLANQKEHYSYNRDSLACDLGLFSTPTKHRVCATSVWTFIESGKGYSSDGFPFGFRGALHLRYLWQLPMAQGAFEELSAASDRHGFTTDVFDPKAQLDILRRHRAPHIFMEMVADAAPELLAQPGQCDIALDLDWLDFDELEILLQSDFDRAIANHIRERYETTHESRLDAAGYELLMAAIREPGAERFQACSAIQEYPDFRSTLARWRISLRTQLAQAYQEGKFNEYRDDNFVGTPILLSTSREGRAMTLLLRPLYVGGMDIVRWRVCAALMVLEAASQEWVVAGSLSGDYIHPAGEGSYESPGSVVEYFDDQGDLEMLRTWQLLQGLYFPRAGYVDYGDWVNDDFGVALASLSPWVAPKHRGTDVLKWLFEDFVEAFQEYGARTWDADWRGWIQSDAEDGIYYEEDLDCVFNPAGVVFIPLPEADVLGYSVWDSTAAQASGQVLISGGERITRASRMRKGYGGEIERHGIAWRLVDAVKDIPADFVFFDPYAKA
jgi:GNAT superfamily N-acetyltransferase